LLENRYLITISKSHHQLSPHAPEAENLEEQPAWEAIRGVWRPVHGGIFRHGYSLEWHDFRLAEALDWSRSFHAGTMEICLNFGGQATLGSRGKSSLVEPGQIALYSAEKNAERSAETMHRFFTLEMTGEYLHRLFHDVLDNIRPEVLRYAENPDRSPGLISVAPLPATLLSLRMHLLEPPVFPSAYGAWYQSKILEILSATLFVDNRPAEMFCSQHKRLNRERVEHARFLLERDMEDPPSLELLATEVGCSAFHLSRIFSQECGVSIPKYLRQRRIEKAAEMLRARSVSVTEVAMAVGYSSLSAFIKAFVEQYNVLPSLYGKR